MPVSSRFLILGLIAALAACGGDGVDAKAGKEPMETHAHTNRLIDEKSPYLLQHAHNPVDWYPWGEEALERAKVEDKPIFLSIGYSTCHWCHVMEHESFENEEIAAYLNAHFVPIKVDREERPDLDGLYMTAVQGMTGSGGWPMSVFLTTELKPFFAGTYFPPEDAYGRPGFRTLLTKITEAWTTQRDVLETQGERTVEFIRSQSGSVRRDDARGTLTDSLLTRAFQQVASGYDARLGGFGRAPKFPTPHKLTFLLRYGERTGDAAERDQAREMVRGTLDAMAAGGIHDHLGGGFHRYSTDERWLAPHFEKMLYDQAGLALAYLSAWLVTGEDGYATVTRDILDYTLRDLGHPGGGFYAAEDADSEGEEGTFYVWSATEIDSVLGDAGPEFRKAYQVSDMGNWEGKNILHLAAFDPAVSATWAGARAKLKAVRDERIRPHRDEKIIVGWNGFMIEAMAKAGAALGEPRYLEGATRAATFIEAKLYRDGRLMRHHRDGTADIGAFQEDYSFLLRGYLALYEATFDARWLTRSVFLAKEMDRLFTREQGGYNVAGKDAETLLAPVVEIYDGAMPSGNSAAAVALLALGHLTADNALKGRGWAVLETFVKEMAGNPVAYLELLSGLDFALGPNTEIVIAGDAADKDVKSMLSEIRSRYLPNGVWAWRPPGSGDPVLALIPYLEAQSAIDGKATAYVCRDYACRLPVHLASELGTQLDER